VRGHVVMAQGRVVGEPTGELQKPAL